MNLLKIYNLGGFTFDDQALFIGAGSIVAVILLICAYILFIKPMLQNKQDKNNINSEAESNNITDDIVTSMSTESEIIAVIAAAIAMAESECSDIKFRVVSFKKR